MSGLRGVELALDRLAVFWGRGGRGAPTGGALEIEGRLFPLPAVVAELAAAVVSTASPLGEVTPLSFPLNAVELDVRRALEGPAAAVEEFKAETEFLPGLTAVVGAEWTEVVESMGGELESYRGRGEQEMMKLEGLNDMQYIFKMIFD